MLAEAIHSFADTGNQGLLFLGGRRARRPRPTTEHPFGYGAERYFWSFVVALVLFSLGGLFALFEGIEKFIHPHEIESPGIALVDPRGRVRARGVLAAHRAPGGAARTRVGVVVGVHPPLEEPRAPGRAARGQRRARRARARDRRASRWSGHRRRRFDGAGSIAIGLLLVVIAIVLATEMRSLLIGESREHRPAGRDPAAIADGPEVDRIIHLRTLHLGPDELLVGAKLDFAATSVDELAPRDRHRRGADPRRGARSPG